MTIFGTSLTSSSYSCVQEREGTLRGATWNRYDTTWDWREGQIVTAGRQLTLHVHMHMHTLTKNWQKIPAMGLFSTSYILTILPDLTYVNVLLVLCVIYDCISKHLASPHPQIYQLPLTLLQNSWPWIMSLRSVSPQCWMGAVTLRHRLMALHPLLTASVMGRPCPPPPPSPTSSSRQLAVPGSSASWSAFWPHCSSLATTYRLRSERECAALCSGWWWVANEIRKRPQWNEDKSNNLDLRRSKQATLLPLTRIPPSPSKTFTRNFMRPPTSLWDHSSFPSWR